MKTNNDILLEELSENICLLTLIAYGKLDKNATQKDCTKYFWSIGEDCESCDCKCNCLAYMYTGEVTL